jgi:drug/metabolite transporter (DMT)-like permease
MRHSRTVILVWWATCLIWSTVWLFIRVGVRDIPPLSFAGLRLIIAVAVLLVILRLRGLRLPSTAREWRLIAGTGLLLLGLNYALVFWGAQHVSSGLLAVLQAATPAFGLLFARLVPRGESLTAAKVGGMVLGLAGVCLISWDQMRAVGAPALAGSLAVTAAAACVALAYVLVKAHGAALDPLVLCTGQMLVAIVPLVTAGLVLDGNPMQFHWTQRALISLVYLALAGSVAAFWLNYWLLARVEASAILAMSLVEPALAVLLGALVLGERLTRNAALGGVAVLVSVWLMARISLDRPPEGLRRAPVNRDDAVSRTRDRL